MRYRYRCTSEKCGVLNERVQSIHDKIPTDIECKFCGEIAAKVIEAPAVLTQNMGNQVFDVAVGRDSQQRWDAIHAQQEKRDSVRVKANQVGLAAEGFNNYVPISDSQRQIRTDGMKAVEKDGFRDNA